MPKVTLDEQDVADLTEAINEVYTDGIEKLYPDAIVEDSSIEVVFEDRFDEDDNRVYVKRYKATITGLPDDVELSYVLIADGFESAEQQQQEQMGMSIGSQPVQLEAIERDPFESELTDREFDDIAAIGEDDVLAEVEEIADSAS